MAETTARSVLAASAVYGVEAETLRQAIEAGFIRPASDPAEVKIKKDTSPTGKDEVQPYAKLEAVTAEGMAILTGGKIEPATPAPKEGKDERTPEQKRDGACDHFNYGLDLQIRQTIRGKLATELEGPAKTIEKLAKALLENGWADTIEDARAQVIAKRVEKGMAV